MQLQFLERFPLSIPSLILILAGGLIVARIAVKRVYAIPPAWRSSVVETLDASIFAALLSLLIITFVVQAFFIPSGSMEPTLQIGDRILVSKFTYRIGGGRPGDIARFPHPLQPGQELVERGGGPERDTGQ